MTGISSISGMSNISSISSTNISLNICVNMNNAMHPRGRMLGWCWYYRIMVLEFYIRVSFSCFCILNQIRIRMIVSVLV